MKVKDILALSPEAAAFSAIKLPIKISYRIAKNLKLIQKEIAAFEEQRLVLAKEHGELTEDGQQYLFKEAEKRTAFESGMEDLQNEEVDIKFMTFTPDELGDLEIEPRILAVLDGHFLVEAAE